MKSYADFVSQFPESKEIGRDITDTEVTSYVDNGTDVGCWRQNRRTTCGTGEVLSHENAEIARAYYRGRDRGR